MKFVTVIGGIAINIEGIPFSPLISKDSNPGTVAFSFGGVGKNISENLAKLRISNQLISAVGKDKNGSEAIAYCKEAGIITENIQVI